MNEFLNKRTHGRGCNGYLQDLIKYYLIKKKRREDLEKMKNIFTTLIRAWNASHSKGGTFGSPHSLRYSK